MLVHWGNKSTWCDRYIVMSQYYSYHTASVPERGTWVSPIEARTGTAEQYVPVPELGRCQVEYRFKNYPLFTLSKSTEGESLRRTKRNLPEFKRYLLGANHHVNSLTSCVMMDGGHSLLVWRITTPAFLPLLVVEWILVDSSMFPCVTVVCCWCRHDAVLCYNTELYFVLSPSILIFHKSSEVRHHIRINHSFDLDS